jgi:hypothetical protein
VSALVVAAVERDRNTLADSCRRTAAVPASMPRATERVWQPRLAERFRCLAPDLLGFGTRIAGTRASTPSDRTTIADTPAEADQAIINWSRGGHRPIKRGAIIRCTPSWR